MYRFFVGLYNLLALRYNQQRRRHPALYGKGKGENFCGPESYIGAVFGGAGGPVSYTHLHQYGVSYPTVRLRLDRLIQKIQLNEQAVEEPYIRLVKQLAVDDKLDLETARLLIQEYRKAQKEES